ncbi:hypothetical protein HHL28_03995 [Aerophototrophica crusticola]|uniref:Uncharacterized protein n=1 Tax=Aerophototrophica crusticola TaxID=1709002 RepID=A0A858R4M2_9PROT|nr:hypothetical protein HHL28_03995 [Rhodospirillaceae bacterium B3]
MAGFSTSARTWESPEPLAAVLLVPDVEEPVSVAVDPMPPVAAAPPMVEVLSVAVLPVVGLP